MNPSLCIQGFNDVVEFTARLSPFSASTYSEVLARGPHDSRARELAIRDLVTLAVSLRRLLELTEQTELFRSREFIGLLEKPQHKYNAWETIGTIIHCREINIFTSMGEIGAFFSQDRDIITLYNLYMDRKSINAAVWLRSDRGTPKLFELAKFLAEVISTTEEIDDFLSENKIHVGLNFE